MRKARSKMATSSQFIPVVKSQLDFFKPKAIQTSQTGYETIRVKPTNAVNARTKRLEFHHPGKGTDFMRNLANTQFYIKGKIAKANGTAWTAAERGDLRHGIINYLGQTIISSLDVALNGTTITRNSENYAYRAYIEALLSSNKLDTECHLATGGFALDTGGNPSEPNFTDNTGLATRSALVNAAGDFEFISRLHGDIFNSNLFLPQGLDLDIKLNLCPDSFLLLVSGELPATTPPLIFHLEEAALYLEICHINPSVLTAQAQVFEEHNAIIPVQHVEVHNISTASGFANVTLDNIFTGRIPSMILVGMVDNATYSGSVLTNPLAFKHYNLTDLCLYVNGAQHRIAPLNFDNNLNMLGYNSLVHATGLLSEGEASAITYDMFKRGYAIFGFDLGPEGSSAGHGTHSSVPPVGNVRLEARFHSNLEQAVTFIIYAVFEGGSIEIDKMRNVYVSL